MTARAGGSVAVRLVVIGDDEIDAELARAQRGIGARGCRSRPRPRARTPSACSRSIAGRLKAVAVAQPLRDEMHDVAAEHLERAPEDDGRRDAVHVVVAVDRDPLPLRERAARSGRPPGPCR